MDEQTYIVLDELCTYIRAIKAAGTYVPPQVVGRLDEAAELLSAYDGLPSNIARPTERRG